MYSTTMLSRGSMVNCVNDDADIQSSSILDESECKFLMDLVQTRDTDRIARGILTIKPLMHRLRNNFVDQCSPVATSQLVHKPIALRPENNILQPYETSSGTLAESPVDMRTLWKKMADSHSISEAAFHSLRTFPATGMTDLNIKKEQDDQIPEQKLSRSHSDDSINLVPSPQSTVEGSSLSPIASSARVSRMNSCNSTLSATQTSPSKWNSELTESDISEQNLKKYKARNYTFPSKRPLKCNICSKVVRADNFQVHIRSHTGEKPYKCPKCPFRSANPSSMPKHLRLHEKGKTIHYCSLCSYSTMYKSSLITHKRMHGLEVGSNESPIRPAYEPMKWFASTPPSLINHLQFMPLLASNGQYALLNNTSPRHELTGKALNSKFECLNSETEVKSSDNSIIQALDLTV